MSDDTPVDPRRPGGPVGSARDTLGGNGIDPVPKITAIKPRSAPPGTDVVITGTLFGEGGQVSFLTGAPGAAPVPAATSAWAFASITARVPDLPVGGAVTVTVEVGPEDDRQSASYVMTVFEPSPPVAAVAPHEGLAGVAVVVTGSFFGYPTRGGAPFGASLGVDGTALAGVKWDRTRLEATLPPGLAPGMLTLVVHTPWGDASMSFLVHAALAIGVLTPAAPTPGGLLAFDGQGFGDQRGAVFVGGTNAPQVQAEIVSWKDMHIEIRVPGRARLGWGPGKTLLTVTTAWAATQKLITIALRASVTTWARIEAHQRIDDLEAGLRLGLQARVYDPAWLLACQWRLREFELEDAGSPLAVTVEADVYPLARWQAPGQAAVPLAQNVPLETLVEREPRSDVAKSVRWNRRLAVEAGLQFWRMIGASIPNKQRIDQYRARYLQLYGIAPPAAAEPDAATRRFLDVVAGRIIDGARLHVALRDARPKSAGGTATLPKDPNTVADRAAMLKLIAAWYVWCDGLLSEGRPTDVTWDASRVEYRFAASADIPGGEATLVAREYDGGMLDWHDFVRDTTTSLRGTAKATQPKKLRATMIPSPAHYPGMPAERWWQFEDARVDFGGVDAAPSDLARMLLVEFATVYGNDWFVVPLAEVAPNSIVHLTAVTVANTFGDPVPVTALAHDPRAADLHLFELTTTGSLPNGALASADMLFLPATIPASMESAPIERVDFVRDEAANMAWGVESLVESGLGLPRDRAEAWAAARQAATQAPQTRPPAIAPIAYRLRTDVPPYWIPFVPAVVDQRVWLQRVGMPDVKGTPIPPQGQILGGSALALYDEEVPPEGAQVTRTYQYARGADGSTYLWLARRRRPGALRTSSDLRFDSVEPTP